MTDSASHFKNHAQPIFSFAYYILTNYYNTVLAVERKIFSQKIARSNKRDCPISIEFSN